jgi:peptidoglycan DL-endopeptidase CwlO
VIRSRAAVALAAACVIAALAPAPVAAAPSPGPTGPGTPASGSPTTPADRPPAGPSTGPPGAPGAAAPVPDAALVAVREKLERLHHEAVGATDAYNAAEERAKTQSAEVAALEAEVETGKRRLAELADRTGAAARAQYRGGGLPPEVHLLMSPDPQGYLRDVTLVRQAQQGTIGLAAALRESQRDLEHTAAEAAARLRALDGTRRARAAAQRRIEERIREAERIEARLKTRELERLREMELREERKSQEKWTGSGILDRLKGKATPKGLRAIAFAERQIGKPYGWGDEGPDAFDCSGLTQMAWADAGIGIPRVSQDQWRLLPRVAMVDMRPGDLVIYRKDAGHVSIYIGGGEVIHAPRTGRDITVAPVAMMPILGVVRPER